MGGAGGVGGSVVLAGHPHDRVGVVLAAAGDGDAGAEGQGGFPVAQGLVAVGVVGVGRDAVVGVESVEGLLAVTAGRLGLGGARLEGWVGADAVPAPARRPWGRRRRPERRLGWLHGLVDRPQGFNRHAVEVDLVAQPSTERLDNSGRVVAASIEAPVDLRLEPAAGRLGRRWIAGGMDRAPWFAVPVTAEPLRGGLRPGLTVAGGALEVVEGPGHPGRPKSGQPPRTPAHLSHR
jgi:hypothetical protein